MWSEFIASWPLFHNAYLAGAAMAVMLGLTGVLVVARNQIFLGAALAQASTLGIAVLLWLGSLSMHVHEWIEHGHGSLHLAGVVFSMIAALFAHRESGQGKESREAITGWIFLLGASVSVLLVANSPHGLEEIQRLQSSSLIGATFGDVVAFAALSAIGIVLVGLFRQRLILLAVDPVMASAVGLRVAWWSLGLALWIGVVIGAALYSAGTLFTFGCLVLPALIAKNLSREIAPMFWWSPLLALLAALSAFVLANYLDFPPGQMTVGLLAAAVPIAWLVRRFRN